MIDAAALRMVLMALTGWVDRREGQAIAYLIEENRSCGVSLADGGRVSRITIAGGWLEGDWDKWAARLASARNREPEQSK